MVAEEEEKQVVDMVAEEEEEAGDWSNVPYHMVELIMNKLMTPAQITDYIRCSTVCTSWRTAFIHHHHHPPPGKPSVALPPFLIVPSTCSSSNKKKKKKNTKSLSFYDVIHKKVYNELQITIPSHRHFRGSSHGWLVAVDQDNYCQIRLFNPFLSPVPSSSGSDVSNANANNKKVEILLPSLKDISIVINKTYDDSDDAQHYRSRRSPSSYIYLKKAILSADPLSSPIDYIVMAILGAPGRLAYCKPGGGGCHDKAWTIVEFEYDKKLGFRDVIYYKDKFYALYHSGMVVVIDPTQNMMAVTLETLERPKTQLLWADAMYIVEYAGTLLQVHRVLEVGAQDSLTDSYSTTKFNVFKIWDETKKKNYDIAKMHDHHHQGGQKEESAGRMMQWKKLKDLCGKTLFLGDNHSMCIRASDYPGCKPNSIYFTDDYSEMYHCMQWNGPHDLGVFNLVDGTIENHYPTDNKTPIWPVPIWIQKLY